MDLLDGSLVGRVDVLARRLKLRQHHLLDDLTQRGERESSRECIVYTRTVSTKKTIQAGSALLLPLFSFPLYFILFFQRFGVLGAKGPKIEFPKIASAFLFSVCIVFLVLTVVLVPRESP